METQQVLFGFSGLPTWLPDETLYSLASRYHRRSGHASPRRTTVQLFGVPKLPFPHDFPCHLEAFVSRTRGIYGSVEEIVSRRTVAPLVAAFRQPQEARALVIELGSGAGKGLKARLGLLASGFRSNNPLKSCGACQAEDGNRWGEAYWHREHQLPGVWVCPTHECLLREGLPAGWQAAYLLPDTATHVDPPGCSESIAAMSSLARIVIGLSRAGTQWPPERLRAIYRQKLKQMGLFRGAQIKLQPLATGYRDLCEQARRFPTFSRLPDTQEWAKVWLGATLRSRIRLHPLRHALAVQAVFGDWAEFALFASSVREPAEERESEKPASRIRVNRFRKDTTLTRDRARRAITQLIATGETRTAVMEGCAAEASWLKRHDRAWLMKNLPKPRSAMERRPSANWTERDAELAAEIQALSLIVRHKHPGQRPARWMLWNLNPTLKPHLGRSDRMPMVRAALNQFLTETPGA